MAVHTDDGQRLVSIVMPGREAIAMILNLGRRDRALRMALGIGLGIAGILVNGHPYVGRALGVTGALVLLSGACGT